MEEVFGVPINSGVMPDLTEVGAGLVGEDCANSEAL